MSMSKRQFRTKQAIEAFEACGQCEGLPESKKGEVATELRKARARLEQQDAEVNKSPNNLILALSSSLPPSYFYHHCYNESYLAESMT